MLLKKTKGPEFNSQNLFKRKGDMVACTCNPSDGETDPREFLSLISSEDGSQFRLLQDLSLVNKVDIVRRQIPKFYLWSQQHIDTHVLI